MEPVLWFAGVSWAVRSRKDWQRSSVICGTPLTQRTLRGVCTLEYTTEQHAEQSKRNKLRYNNGPIFPKLPKGRLLIRALRVPWSEAAHETGPVQKLADIGVDVVDVEILLQVTATCHLNSARATRVDLGKVRDIVDMAMIRNPQALLQVVVAAELLEADDPQFFFLRHLPVRGNRRPERLFVKHLAQGTPASRVQMVQRTVFLLFHDFLPTQNWNHPTRVYSEQDELIASTIRVPLHCLNYFLVGGFDTSIDWNSRQKTKPVNTLITKRSENVKRSETQRQALQSVFYLENKRLYEEKSRGREIDR